MGAMFDYGQFCSINVPAISSILFYVNFLMICTKSNINNLILESLLIY
uniref:Uncharacterized protein n=1 Tax=Rhizophora mucronata TaxID=61149 RepID=A0A2P2QQ26_RHIMU